MCLHAIAAHARRAAYVGVLSCLGVCCARGGHVLGCESGKLWQRMVSISPACADPEYSGSINPIGIIFWIVHAASVLSMAAF